MATAKKRPIELRIARLYGLEPWQLAPAQSVDELSESIREYRALVIVDKQVKWMQEDIERRMGVLDLRIVRLLLLEEL